MTGMHVIILIRIVKIALMVVIEVIVLHINVVKQICFDRGVIMEILVMENVLGDMFGMVLNVKKKIKQTVVSYHIHVIQYL